MLRQAVAHPLLLWCLAALPLLAGLALWARRRRRQALLRLGGLAALERRPRWALVVRRLSLLLGLACLAVGAAGPRWGRDWSQAAAPGRDLVVVLDCSRSMLAERPSRLEQARTALLDLDEALRRRGGYRVALVTFAARAKVVCPLTHDLDHFREALLTLDLSGPDPDLTPVADDPSGTRIGRALAMAALAVHDSRFAGARDILLLSDGDDPARDGEWRKGAARVHLEGIPCYCVGLGDPDEDHPVPPGTDRRARTRLHRAPLREIARLTGGSAIFPGKRARLPLGMYYLAATAEQPVRQESGDALPVLRPRYPWFLGPAFALLSLTLLLPDRRWRRRTSASPRSP
jgi:Ca-activated chloride channel family protein